METKPNSSIAPAKGHKVRPSFITYYDGLDREHLFSVQVGVSCMWPVACVALMSILQPTVLYVIALFMLGKRGAPSLGLDLTLRNADLTCELTTWVMLGQQQFGSLLTFAQLYIVNWQFRTSLFDMIIIAIVRAIVAGGVLWRWRTIKGSSSPQIAIVVLLASLGYGVAKLVFILETPGSMVMADPFVAYFVPIVFLATGLASLVLISVRLYRMTHPSSLLAGYQALPQKVVSVALCAYPPSD
jgi:hypothetical protein